MDEDRTQNQDEHESEQASEHESKLYFDKSGRIVDQDGNDIKDNPEALEKLQKLTRKINQSIMAVINRIDGETIKKAAHKTENAVFDIVAESSTDEEIKEYYSLLKQLPPEEYPKAAAAFSERLYQYQHIALFKIKAAAAEEERKLIEIGEKAGKLKARAESVKSYLKNELQKDIYNGETIETLLDDRPAEALADPDDDKTKLLLQAIAAAEKAAHKATAEAAAVNAKRAEAILYPLDKINNSAWNLLTGDTGGQLKIVFDLLPKKPKMQATAIYSINFDDLGDNVKITKKLQPFDKRVYIAISALYNAGNNVISATQIYYAMGNTGTTPAQYQIEKINNSLSKMAGAKIILDNKQEAEALKRREYFKYTGSLLPIENITAFVNGKVTESAIHIFREPPLMTFAKQRDEITTFDVKLLQSPLSKTDANLLIDDYLIERISRGKHSTTKSHRILFVTLYEHANITTAKQRERAQDKIKKYLDHYKKQAFFKRYTIQSDGITIYY